MILNHPLFQRFENIPFIVCNFKFFLGYQYTPPRNFSWHGGHLVLEYIELRVVADFYCAKMHHRKYRGRCFLPIFRPYGTTGNTGVVVFYPHSVPTGLWKTPGLFVFYPHRVPTGLRKYRGRCFLPTFRPYGTPGNTGVVVFYPHRVPTGLRKTPGPVFSTHIASLRDFGKHRGRCFLPTFRPYGTLENTGVVVFYPHSVPTGLRETPGANQIVA
jgi:hypothetical protein